MTKQVHAAGMFGGIGKRKTWCGPNVNDDQLPILGTDREIDCVACARSQQARAHARRWGYNYAKSLRMILARNVRVTKTG